MQEGRRKYCVRLSVIFCSSLIILAIICSLIIFGIKEKNYYNQNYVPAEAKIVNFTVKQEFCSEPFLIKHSKTTYKGYINIEYTVDNIEYLTQFTRDKYCYDHINETLRVLNTDYHINECFYIWIYINDPVKWVFQKPQGEIYIVCMIFFIFLFIFSIFIGLIYTIRDKKYLSNLSKDIGIDQIEYV